MSYKNWHQCLNDLTCTYQISYQLFNWNMHINNCLLCKMSNRLKLNLKPEYPGATVEGTGKFPKHSLKPVNLSTN